MHHAIPHHTTPMSYTYTFAPLQNEWPAISKLQPDFPNLKIIKYNVNGADDVCKYQKW